MRQLVDVIDHAFANKTPDEGEKLALYEVVAHTLAAQALAVSAAAGLTMTEKNARRWIEYVANYPGVTMRHTDPGRTRYLGDRAEEIAKFLIRLAETVKRRGDW